MYKTLTTILLLFMLGPSVVEAGVGSRRTRPRCRTNGGITVCRMPRVRKPRIPPGYYRPNPPRVVPMK